MTASPRRIGAEDSATRTALLDAALALMVEEGYAAVTSRRVAAKAGLKPQLVHYYFRTMDDLFLALVRRGAEHNLERQARALASPQPLRALWAFATDPAVTLLSTELAALANHRKAIRAEIGAYAEQFRRIETEALAKILAAHDAHDTRGAGAIAEDVPPAAVAMLVSSVARILVLEEALGMTTGPAEMRALVERYLTRYEPEPEPEPSTDPPATKG